MPRKLRIEYPGAIYHVINRGNRRVGPFDVGGAAEVFEGCLGEACERYGWAVHAYVVMSNHYHLALETPEGNLCAGMQWLQTTFSNRYNRYRGETGHVFQGRYKALVVEAGEYLRDLVAYIDLNPVRAGICELEKLADYGFGSYRLLPKPMARPGWLKLGTCLSLNGGLTDDSEGWAGYREVLASQIHDGPAGTSEGYVKMSKGWVLGSEGFKAKLIGEHNLLKETRAWEKSGAKEVAQFKWEKEVERQLGKLGKTEADVENDRKSAAWKVAICVVMKGRVSAGNAWLGKRLKMGGPNLVSQVMCLARSRPERYVGYLAKLTKN